MKKLLCALLMIATVFALTACGIFVKSPEIEEGRFNFSVTYECDGEIKTVSGVYVCEYAGASWSIEGGGFSRDWDYHYEGVEAGGGGQIHVATIDDGGKIYISLGFYPQYFMDDPEIGELTPPEPIVYIEYANEDDDMASSFGDEEMIAELYGIKIISYQYDDPIENTFG